jgi:ABC-2 type transport system permease protein
VRRLWTMTVFDLRQRVRDKSVIIFALLVPLALMSVLNLVIGDSQDIELDAVTVAAAAPQGDELAETLLGVLTGMGELDVRVERVAAEEVDGLAESGEAQLGVIVPEGFGAAVTSGEPVQVEVVEGDGAGLETDILISLLQGVLDRFTAGVVTAAAGAQVGVPASELATAAREVAAAESTIAIAEGEAATEQLSPSAALVAGQAGLFLMFTVGFGVLALLAEREQGTLARLRSMPMQPGLIVTAKALTSFIMGVTATAVLLTVGSMLFGASFGSPLVVAVLILCAVTASTSLMFVVARVARTAEQAGIAQSILAMVLGIAGGAFFPITATGTWSLLLELNPVAAFMRGLGITAGGGGLSDVGLPVALMLGFALVAAAISRLVPDRGVAQ